MKKILLLLVLCAICAFGQPTAQIWYQITPSPAVGSGCTGLIPWNRRAHHVNWFDDLPGTPPSG